MENCIVLPRVYSIRVGKCTVTEQAVPVFFAQKYNILVPNRCFAEFYKTFKTQQIAVDLIPVILQNINGVTNLHNLYINITY